MEFSSDQLQALDHLRSAKGNLFLTGQAGSGKSTLIQRFLRECDPNRVVILASTGAAALLVGGRTFHSFFGLGILEGGIERTVERALKNPMVGRRLRKCQWIVIDEISMLPGDTLAAAEKIARLARGNDEPWGGLRVIAVGDFSQLPPVKAYGKATDWAFLSDVWRSSDFKTLILELNHRADEPEWLQVLNKIRVGQVDNEVRKSLDLRLCKPAAALEPTRLFARRNEAEAFNEMQLKKLPGEPECFPTEYGGSSVFLETVKRSAPLPEALLLKPGALVMLRKNDPNGLFVNGSLGTIKGITKRFLTIALLESGAEIDLEPTKFELLDGDGDPVAFAKNFPLNLAYGITIHKAQGATIDAVQMSLSRLWEPGQAYVALSRVRKFKHLYLESWEPRSIFADPSVLSFYGISNLGHLSANVDWTHF